jgi:hypothetical protein
MFLVAVERFVMALQHQDVDESPSIAWMDATETSRASSPTPSASIQLYAQAAMHQEQSNRVIPGLDNTEGAMSQQQIGNATHTFLHLGTACQHCSYQLPRYTIAQTLVHCCEPNFPVI